MKTIKITKTLKTTVSIFLISVVHNVLADNSSVNGAINNATKEIGGYFDSATKLMYAISAIIGLIGGIKVYSKWNSGDPDTQKVAASWFGACIFLVVVATVIKTFFAEGFK